MRLSPKYTTEDWNQAFGATPDWEKAISIVEDRIRGRFIRWIDPMVQRQFAGLAIIALDCLLLETLHGSQIGASTRDTRNVYKMMLMAPPFDLDETLALAFYENVRNGLLHDTETRKGWTIRMTPQQKVLEQNLSGLWVVNRTMFHRAVVAVFKNWITRLWTGDQTARDKMRRRMDEITDRRRQMLLTV